MIQKEYPNETMFTLRKENLKKDNNYYSLMRFDKYGHGTGMTLNYEDLLALKDFIQNIDFNTL